MNEDIKKFSKIMLRILKMMLWLLPIMTLGRWTIWLQSFPWSTPLTTPSGMILLQTYEWTTLSWCLGLFGDVLSLSAFYMGVILLYHLFRRYQKSEIFSIRNAETYKNIGKLLILDALINKPLSHLLIVLAVTINQPVGQRYLVVELGSMNFLEIFCGMTVMMIGKVMILGSQLQEEHDYTV